MIVSHRHRFIFIKTRKTAGTSLEAWLWPHCGPDDILTPLAPPVPPHEARNDAGFVNHMPAAEVRAQVGEAVWGSYFKFCVERNPWEKTLSMFHSRRARREATLSLDEFMAAGRLPVDHELYTEPGRPAQRLVDRVLRYENLDAELGEVLSALGLPWTGRLDVQAKADYRTDRRPAREVFTEAQAAQVARRFAREIRWFGYSL